MFVAKLPEKHSCLLISSSFIEGKNITGNTVLEKHDLFALTAKCYFKSLSLVEDNFMIWYDLAVCYLSHALNPDTTSELKQQLICKSQTILQYCTSNNPTYWQHWNLLGNVAMYLGSF